MLDTTILESCVENELTLQCAFEVPTGDVTMVLACCGDEFHSFLKTEIGIFTM